ncbi:hypothetical protein NUSPORA_01992 [Nucleospora cyclopteri]
MFAHLSVVSAFSGVNPQFFMIEEFPDCNNDNSQNDSEPCKPTVPVYSTGSLMTGATNSYSDAFKRLALGFDTLGNELNQLRINYLSNLENSLIQSTSNLRIPDTTDIWKGIQDTLVKTYSLSDTDAKNLVNSLKSAEESSLGNAFGQFQTSCSNDITTAFNVLESNEQCLTSNQMRAQNITFTIKSIIDKYTISLSQYSLSNSLKPVIESISNMNAKNYLITEIAKLNPSYIQNIMASLTKIKKSIDTTIAESTTNLIASQTASFQNMTSMIQAELKSISTILGITPIYNSSGNGVYDKPIVSEEDKEEENNAN